MDAEKIIIQATDITIGYTSKKHPIKVAEHVTTQLTKGKLIGLIGENGIGKSTLLRTLTGIQRPLHGQVLLEGKNIMSYTPSILAQKISLVLTEKLPPSNLSVYDLIALGRQPYTNWLGRLAEADVQKINQAIALVQIEHLRDKKHFELSDGQMQSVMIARALAQDTPIIILDEPSTHLDLWHKVALFKLLKKLTQETQKCVLFSTHDIDLAIQMSDELIVMTKEKISQNSPCQLITQGIFETLFQDETIRFDPQRGLFVVK